MEKQITLEQYKEWDQVDVEFINVDIKVEEEYKAVKEFIKRQTAPRQMVFLFLKLNLKNWEFWKPIIYVLLNKIK